MTDIPTIDAYKMPTSAHMPGNIAPWRFDAGRAVLLVHDMQKYFVERLPADGLGDTLVANSVALKARCLQSHAPVAYTMQPGRMTTEQRGLLHDFWGAGMQSSVAQRAVVDGLGPADDDWLITKWRYSAFFGSNLLARMRAAERDQLIICGVYAHIGVLMTAVEAFSNDIQTFVVADAIADFSLERHLMALQYAANCCAVVLATREITGG